MLIRRSITRVTPFFVLFLKKKKKLRFFVRRVCITFSSVSVYESFITGWFFHHFVHFVFRLRQAHQLYFTNCKLEWQDTLFSHVVAYSFSEKVHTWCQVLLWISQLVVITHPPYEISASCSSLTLLASCTSCNMFSQLRSRDTCPHRG